ncbi:MAG: hypothetical protein ACYCSN_17335, partial [Acidobacteriaceae bacterium]
SAALRVAALVAGLRCAPARALCAFTALRRRSAPAPAGTNNRNGNGNGNRNRNRKSAARHRKARGSHGGQGRFAPLRGSASLRP